MAAMATQALVVGGGIGGLAAALAATRTGWDVRLFERAPAFSEVGAGIQLGPNVVRLLQAWGLGAALQAVAAFPERLQVRSATGGQALAMLALHDMPARYGAPYATLHRADLHRLLWQGLQAQDRAALYCHLDTPVAGVWAGSDAVRLRTASGTEVEGDALVGADGLWSRVRAHWGADAPPPATGHLAYRSLQAQAALPAALRSQQVTVWLGPRLHVVQYPVQVGAALNVVVIVHGRQHQTGEHWDRRADPADLHGALAGTCSALQDLVRALPEWQLWTLHDRPPLSGPEAMARGPVALLGDAAHPMRPYLAQGAGMAIEDAAELGRALAMDALDVPTRLRRYALNRWQRNARVQARARRNGQVFHARGPLRWGRDLALRLLGPHLLDQPWLYRGGPPAG